MSAASTFNIRATDADFDEPYLWRGGRFLALYIILLIEAMVALAIRLM
jgi:hypothetical protein